MNGVIQDLWHDLRAKRLWPIAAVLVLGIVAIPAVLAKSAAPPPAPVATPAPAEPGDKDALALHLENAGASGKGSPLDVLVERNPFKPPRSVMSGGDAASTASGSSATAGDEGDSAGGTPDGGGNEQSAPEPAPAPTTTVYQYVADVTFWNGSKRRTIKGLRKLDMLPSQAAPVLIFMGAGAKGGNAVFLVDSTLKAAGEGRCRPGPANCAFVAIGPGSEHAFTTEEGDSYRLRIDEIRRVRFKPRASGSGRTDSADGDAEALASTQEPRRFAPPWLTDLVEVTAVEEQATSDERPTSR